MTTSDTSWVLITGASSGFGLMMYAIPLENMSFGGGKLPLYALGK
jgi:NADP-dependent 3-hydroxy acid dehydrogenase YdfG